MNQPGRKEGRGGGEKEGVRTGEKGEGRCIGWEQKNIKMGREGKERIQHRLDSLFSSHRLGCFSLSLPIGIPYITRYYG